MICDLQSYCCGFKSGYTLVLSIGLTLLFLFITANYAVQISRLAD